MKRIMLAAFLGLSFLSYEFVSGMNPININVRDCNGDTALLKAVQEENMSEIQTLLNQGANPNLQNQYGYSAFCIAVQQGNLDLVKALFNKGVKVNPDGLRTVTTPLIDAVKAFCQDPENMNRLDIVKFLLEKEADPNIRPDDYGATAIDIVIQNKNVNLLKLLFEHGAKVDTWSGLGEYPLHSAVHVKDLSITTFLLNNKANPNVSNAMQNTPLHLAAGIGNIEILQLLLDKGGNPNALNYEQDSPLHAASNAEVAEILLKNNAEIDAKNKDEDTPLHVAARKGNIEVVQALVKNGANINAINGRGETPLVVMIYKAVKDWHISTDMLNMLCTKETKLSFSLVGPAIYSCAANDNNELLEFVLSKISDFNDRRGASSLYIAVNNDNLDGAEILIKYGANPNAKSRPFNNDMPLCYAVSKYKIKSIKFLLANGALINTTNGMGNTPIHEALKYKDDPAADMIKIMLESQGVDISSKEEVNTYMQENFDNPNIISRVISLLFSSRKKVFFQLP